MFRYYIHDDWRSVVFEQVSTYNVNGVEGYGIFEFLYRSVIASYEFISSDVNKAGPLKAKAKATFPRPSHNAKACDKR